MAERKTGGKTTAKPGPRRRSPSNKAKVTKRAQQQAEARARKAAEASVAASPLEAVREMQGAARTVENAELYLKVFRDWARGMQWDDLGKRHKLSPRRCREIVEDLKAEQLHMTGVSDPLFGIKLANDLVLRYSAAVSEYAELAAKARMQSVRLGALKRRDDAMDRFVDLMQELGYLPKQLGTLRFMADAVTMGETLLDVMDAKGVPQDVQRACVEALELRVRQRDGRLMLDMTSTAFTDTTAEDEVPDATVAA